MKWSETFFFSQEKRLRAFMRLVGVVEQEGSEFALLPTFNLTVRRGHLIEDVLNQLNQFENEDLRRELLVKYNSYLMFLLLRQKT